MSDYIFVSSEVTTEEGSESSKICDRQVDDQVICHVNITVSLLTFGDKKDHYVSVEGWPREHVCAIKFDKLLDDREVEAMLKKEHIPVDEEMVQDIVNCAQEMVLKELNLNKKVLCMKVEAVFFDGDLFGTDSDSSDSSDSDSDSDSSDSDSSDSGSDGYMDAAHEEMVE
ncbi:hypothetical protein ACFE04_007379 [Oxalis oulophora]